MTDVSAPRVSAGRLELPKGKSRRAVRIARLHSLFVRCLRHFIIIGCGVTVVALAVIVLFDPFRKLPRNLSVRSVGLEGTMVTLQAPKMKGFRQDGEPFELNGLSGTQDMLKPDIVNLVGVDAKLGMEDQTTAKITARAGIYDNSRDIIWLRDGVRIKNGDSGYEMRMNTARVDFKANSLATQEPVTVLLDGGSTIKAASMVITDNGHKISFGGGVSSAINSPDDASGNSQVETAE